MAGVGLANLTQLNNINQSLSNIGNTLTSHENRLQLFSVLDYGAVFNNAGAASANVTAVNDAIGDAVAYAASSGLKATVQIPPGLFYTNDTIIIPNDVNLFMDGSAIQYTGSLANRALVIGETGAGANTGGIYYGIRVGRAATPSTLSPAEAETSIGVQIFNQSRSVFHIPVVSDFGGIGIQLKPYADTDDGVGYCSFHIGLIYGVKIALDLQTNGGEGWINENSFYDMDATLGTGVAHLGTTVCIRFSDSGAVGSDNTHNNNRWYSPCFEPQKPPTAYYLSGGSSVVTGKWYINNSLSYPRQYYCKNQGTGTVATVPTNTDYGDSSADANGVIWTDMGPFFRSPVYHKKASLGYNRIYGARWETGAGPFAMVEGSNSLAQYKVTGLQNLYEVYALDADTDHTNIAPGIDHATMTTNCAENHLSTELVTYGQPLPPSVIIDNLHLRAIKGANGIAISGLHWTNMNTKTDAQAWCDVPSKVHILKDAIHFDSVSVGADGYCIPGVFLPISDGFRRFKFTYKHKRPAAAAGYVCVNPFDANDKVLVLAQVDPAVTPWNWFITNLTSRIHNTGSWWNTLRSGGNKSSFDVGSGSLSTIKKFNTCIYTNGFAAELSSIELRPYSDGEPAAQFQPHTSYSNSVNVGTRFSPGTPTDGFFNRLGEQIDNCYSNDPPAWRVVRAGQLCTAWANGQSVIIGTRRHYNNNVYAATNAGTTATGSAPTGTTTYTGADGITWEYLSPLAILVPLSNAPAEVAGWNPSTDTTGNGTATLYDTKGYANGTLTNMDPATDWVADTGNSGVRRIDFDGANDHVTMGVNARLQPAREPFAISAWVKTSASGSIMGVAGSGILGSTVGFGLYFNTGGLPGFQYRNGGTASTAESTVNIADGNWHHLLGIRKNGVSQIWVDGVLKASESTAVTMGTITAAFVIGAATTPTLNYYFNGSVDDVRYYNQVDFTAKEMAAFLSSQRSPAY